MNYLKIAQDLEMYGVNYFPIAVSTLFQQFAIAVFDGSVILKIVQGVGAGTPGFCFSLLWVGSVVIVLTWFTCLLIEQVNTTVNINVLSFDKGLEYVIGRRINKLEI